MCEYVEEILMLQKFYKLFNLKYFGGQLPLCVITIQSSLRSYGHFVTAKIWRINEKTNDSTVESFEERYEINLGAEGLKRGLIPTLGTLLHEMVHCYCTINNLKDVSRSGRYHNEVFRKQATERGLELSYSSKIGWSITTVSPSLADYIVSQKIDCPNLFRNTLIKSSKTAKSNRRVFVCPVCSLKVSVTTKNEIHLKCVDCDTILEEVE